MVVDARSKWCAREDAERSREDTEKMINHKDAEGTEIKKKQEKDLTQ
ncbi:MAG TPA: hypothetical protein VE154_05310 [Chthoniobacterales bacterium]|jgi:hypothetical protein|nr:hypothetical protein [Chthoniobacterales bacterium]